MANDGPYIGEVRLFSMPFVIEDWEMCDGSMLSVFEYQPLFSVIGLQFGGDGKKTFGVPDLRGRVPIGNPSSTESLGRSGGSETMRLSSAETPTHSHELIGVASPATEDDPDGLLLGTTSKHPYALPPGRKPVRLAPSTVGSTGNSETHENRQPYAAINFFICSNGVFPTLS
jgi:microcystin-dependent protein